MLRIGRIYGIVYFCIFMVLSSICRVFSWHSKLCLFLLVFISITTKPETDNGYRYNKRGKLDVSGGKLRKKRKRNQTVTNKHNQWVVKWWHENSAMWGQVVALGIVEGLQSEPYFSSCNWDGAGLLEHPNVTSVTELTRMLFWNSWSMAFNFRNVE